MRLILVTDRDSKPARLREFQRSAARLCRLWSPAAHAAVGTGDSIVRAISAAGDAERIASLAICCHGWPDRLVARGRGIRVGVDRPPGQVSLAVLAETLAPRLSDAAHIAVAACSAGANPGLSRWLPGGASYGPGGATSLCAILYRLLAPGCPALCIIGHTTPGHTTCNPALRAWGGSYGVEADGAGVSVLDAHLGPGAHRSAKERKAWVSWCRETGADGIARAERVLAG
jgi:hypothetical protein